MSEQPKQLPKPKRFRTSQLNLLALPTAVLCHILSMVIDTGAQLRLIAGLHTVCRALASNRSLWAQLQMYDTVWSNEKPSMIDFLRHYHIGLGGDNRSDKVTRLVASLPSGLKTLSVSDLTVRRMGLSCFDRLESLSLVRTCTSDRTLGGMKNPTVLRKLALAGSRRINQVTAFTSLDYLDVSFTRVRVLPACHSLHTLKLDGTQITPPDCDGLRNTLRVLSLNQIGRAHV